MSVFGKLGLAGLGVPTTPATTTKETAPVKTEPTVPVAEPKVAVGLTLFGTMAAREVADAQSATGPAPIESVDSDFDTTQIEPIAKPEPKELKSIRQLDVEAMLQGPTGVREVLDEVDRLMEGDQRLSGLVLDTVRNYVHRLMVTLRNNAEFDSILIDKDVRNIVRFAREMRGEAMIDKQVRVQKKAVKESKATTITGKRRALLADFDFTMDAGIFESKNKK